VAPDGSSTRWSDVERLYNAALDQAPSERSAFLHAATADARVRDEVEALLRHDAEAGDFLERSAIEDAALDDVYGPLAPGTRVGDFDIIALVGAGGMGEVYRARDRRLERDVALKIIHRHATGDADANRFEEEARAASGLGHPNIVTIFGVGEHADLAFIAMELVQGQTLGRHLDAGRLPMVEALGLAVQIADALAAAHAAGVVHRDLKPDNIMVTGDGRVKVLDFGIAKRAGVAQNDTGVIRGTAGYMSPEQANGDTTDHRTDQFSFGAVCYELLTGRRAFRRESLTETIRAVKAVELEPIAKVNPDVAPALRSIVERCLQKESANRFASTTEMADALRRARDRWLSEDDRRQSRRRALWLAAAATLTTAGGFSAWRFWPSGIRARSIAVLPFANADQNPAVEYLCDGLAESLMRRLSYLDGVTVQPRSAVFNFKAAAVDPVEAGRRLGVDAVLAGALRVADGRLRVQARLINVASGRDLWADQYDQPSNDALAMQGELARAIVAEGVRYPLDTATRKKVERPPTEHADANDLYLRGLYFHRQGGEDNYLNARRLLRQAVTLDPGFALAQTSLASTFTVMTVDGFERPTAAWPEANRCVRRALEIDPDQPEARSERSASWFFFDRDWFAAETEWRRANNAPASPTLPDLLSASAVKLWALNRIQDALVMTRRARALDPFSPTFAIQEADVLLHDDHPLEAATIYEAVIAAHADEVDAYFGLADACYDQRQFAKAIDIRRRGYELAGMRLPAPREGATDAGYRSIDRIAAEAALARLGANAASGAYVSPLESARCRARLNDRDGAFHDLDAAFEEQSPGLVFLRVDRAWQNVRDDHRFAAVLELAGLP
jgi:TolB-like protein